MVEREKRVKDKHIYRNRKINQDVNENKKLFWKEMSNSNGGKVKRCSRIKD